MATKKTVGKSQKPKVKKVIEKAKTVKKAAAPEKAVKKEKVEAKIAVSKPKKVSLNVSVFDIKGKAAGRVELPSEIFGIKINESLMSQAIRVYLANQKQGTVKTKDRGEINLATKKAWQQKGTGRARHGSRRAPIFVGGGVTFGPKPRDLSLNITKKMKTLALFSALSSKLKDNQIKIIKGLETISPKTKIMAQVLKALELDKTSKILLVIPKAGKESESIYRAGGNIKKLKIVNANSLNTYGVLDNTAILLMKDSVDVIKSTFVKQ